MSAERRRIDWAKEKLSMLRTSSVPGRRSLVSVTWLETVLCCVCSWPLCRRMGSPVTIALTGINRVLRNLKKHCWEVDVLLLGQRGHLVCVHRLPVGWRQGYEEVHQRRVHHGGHSLDQPQEQGAEQGSGEDDLNAGVWCLGLILGSSRRPARGKAGSYGRARCWTNV